MKDRVSLYPGRVSLTPVPGQENTYDMVRADQPQQEGTPLNKFTLLTDETAKKLGLTPDATVNDAIAAAADSGGGMGMSINLLEEVTNMKYCKVLTREEPASPTQEFFANTLVQTGYESDDGNIQALACIERQNPSKLKIRIINKADGKVFNSVVNLNYDMYSLTTTGLTTAGNGNFANFNGWFHFVPVKNRPSEIMLKIDGALGRFSSTPSQVSLGMRMVHIMDVNTGAISAHVYGYYPYTATNSQSPVRGTNGFGLGVGNNDYCYFNATYNYYYTPLGSHDYSSYKDRVYCISLGCNYEISTNGDVTSSANGVRALNGVYYGYYDCIGNTSTSAQSAYHSFSFNWYMPITDDSGVLFYYSANESVVRVYAVSQTGYDSFSMTQLYYSNTFYAFEYNTSFPIFVNANGASGLKTYVLRTEDDKMYLYATGRIHSSHKDYSSGTGLFCTMRIGPFSLETSNDNPPTADVMYRWSANTPFDYTFCMNIIGCKDGNPDKLVFCLTPYSQSIPSGRGGTVNSLAATTDNESVRLMLPSVMAGEYYNSSNANAYRYDGINNPWARNYTLPTCWYNNHLTKMFMCQMDRTVYLGDFVESVTKDTDGEWECPEDGVYKIIMVGGGAAGGTSYAGGSGYMKIATRMCTQGEKIPYHIGHGELYDTTTNPYAAEPGSRTTWFGDESCFANGASMSRGGGNGYPGSSGGGGGGYDLVQYGGNGWYSTSSAYVQNRNGGIASLPAVGYGAGGSAAQSGKDGCIVIVR